MKTPFSLWKPRSIPNAHPALAAAGLVTIVLGMAPWAQAGFYKGSCQPVRIALVPNPNRPNRWTSAVAYPTGQEGQTTDELRTVDSIIPPEVTTIPVYIPRGGKTSGQTSVQATVISRNAFLGIATLKIEGQEFNPCSVAAQNPASSASVTVVSYSDADDIAALYSHSARVGDLTSDGVSPGSLLSLDFTEQDPDVKPGSLVMNANGQIVGLLNKDLATAISAPDVEKLASSPGLSRLTFDAQTGILSVDGLEIHKADQLAIRLASKTLGGYVVVRVKPEARTATAKLLGASPNNALFVTAVGGKTTRTLPAFLSALVSCSGTACAAPSEGTGTWLPETDADPSLTAAALAVADFRFFVENVSGLDDSLRASTADALDQLSRHLQDLDASETRFDEAYRAKSRDIVTFWQQNVDSLKANSLLDQLATALPNADVRRFGRNVSSALQSVGTGR